MKRIAFYPGSFDPLTLGHVDILRQAFCVADEVIVGIGVHPGKTPMFEFDQRAELVRAVISQMGESKRARVVSFDNLVVDAAKAASASMLIRGVRDGSDLDYELQMSGMNEVMEPAINTVFFAASPQHRSITATLVRQIAAMGGNVSPFVPDAVLAALVKKF